MMVPLVSFSESPTETTQSIRGCYYLKNYTKDFKEASAPDYCIVAAKGIYFARDNKSITIELIIHSDLDGVRYTTFVLVDGTRMSFHYSGGNTWIIQVLQMSDELILYTCGRRGD